MGLAIEHDSFEESDYRRFAERLKSSLTALEELLGRPGFGVGEISLGAELELALVGRNARPLHLNLEVIGETLDPRVTFELNRFNLECNLRHAPMRGRPFEALRHEFEGALAEVSRAAALHGGRVVPVGILPTLDEVDLQSGAMTDTARFRALSSAITRLRREPFSLRIDGEDPLDIRCDDVTYEGAATSLQVHLRIDPGRFSEVFNAAQLVTAPVLAVSGNSPIFLGRRLWHETRVALFKQAVDLRDDHAKRNNQLARVSFGTGWTIDGALELIAAAVEQHAVLLPILASEDPLACLRAGGIPALEEIRLHQGTVWHWNRPVYDPAGGGHLRIEMRALPAGPTTIDMLANTALLVGATLGMAPEMADICERFPFEAAHNNFYRCAQEGLEARLQWPASETTGPEGECTAQSLLPRLLPIARRGLVEAGVEEQEADSLLSVIAARCESGQTGAQWQRRVLARLANRMEPVRARAEMLERYIECSRTGLPVHEWPIEAGDESEARASDAGD